MRVAGGRGGGGPEAGEFDVLLDVLTRGQHLRQRDLGLAHAIGRRLLVPAHRHLDVHLRTLTVHGHDGQVVLRRNDAVPRRDAVELDGAVEVAAHALPLAVEDGEVEMRLGMAASAALSNHVAAALAPGPQPACR